MIGTRSEQRKRAGKLQKVNDLGKKTIGTRKKFKESHPNDMEVEFSLDGLKDFNICSPNVTLFVRSRKRLPKANGLGSYLISK